MAKCLIGLGSNLGDRGANMQSAVQQLAILPQTVLVAVSSFHDTKPAGGLAAQPPYLNAAAVVETSLTPQQLLSELQRIENGLGRERTERWGPRTIDLDLLLYDQLELNSPELTLPHPRMSFRRFVLEPAAEIAADMVYPINGWTVSRLLTLSRTVDEGMFVALAPHHSAFFKRSPATTLLKQLAQQPNVQPLFCESAPKRILSRSEELAVRRRMAARKPLASFPVKRGAKWVITNGWLGQDCAELLWPLPRAKLLLTESFQANAGTKLVVVWDLELSPNLELLDFVRRLPQCGPVLWIPGIPLEQAVQEVVAALAAMS